MNRNNSTKKWAMLIALAVLAGCAVNTTGLRMTDLRDPQYLRTERTIPLTFPQIQMALFRHQAACGGSADFSVDARQTSYATMVDRPAGATNFEQAILVDMTAYQGTMMEEARVKTAVYTYYADLATEKRIEQLFNSIAHPGACAEK